MIQENRKGYVLPIEQDASMITQFIDSLFIGLMVDGIVAHFESKGKNPEEALAEYLNILDLYNLRKSLARIS